MLKLRAAIVCALATFTYTATASATPIAEFPVGGSAEQVVWRLAPTSDGRRSVRAVVGRRPFTRRA